MSRAGPPWPAAQSLVWVTRHGQETPIAAPPRGYVIPRLSPDGTRVALYIEDQNQGIWICGSRPPDAGAVDGHARLQFPPGLDLGWPTRHLRVVASRQGERILASGRQHKQCRAVNDKSQRPTSDVDGARRGALVVREIMPTNGSDLRVLRMGGSSPAAGLRQTEPLVDTRFNEQNGDISPDGHWLAYQSDDSGQFQIVVRPFPNVDNGRWTISPTGGTKPVWARSGRELFYLDGTNAVTAVSVHTGPSFSADTPTKLFDVPYLAVEPGRSNLRRVGRRPAVSDDQEHRERRSGVRAGEHGRRRQLDRGTEGETRCPIANVCYAYAAPTMIFLIRSHGEPCEMLLVCVG